MTTQSTRPRISADFLRRNTCERIITGTARVVAERGYHPATVADIVKSCRTARNTFYDCFGGKEEAALAMVAALGVEEIGQSPSIDVLLIEAVAMHHAGEVERAAEFLLGAEDTIRFFADADLNSPPPSTDPREATLPPGRHGLPADFVAANQRARLLSGMAAAITENGWCATTIADVTAKAATSRRTFYEQFGDRDALGRAMVAEAVETDRLDQLDARSGLFAVAVEILAERICEREEPSPTAEKALGAVCSLTVTLDAAVPA